MHRPGRTRIGGWILTALLLAGCVNSIFREPEVILRSVEVGGLGLRGGTLLVNLQVSNPNRFALSASQLDYRLAIRDPEVQDDTTWINFAEGTFDQGFSVGAGDTSQVQIPVDFTYSGLGTAANSLLLAGTFTYRASGTVHVGTPLGSRSVPFQKRGTVTLMGAQ